MKKIRKLYTFHLMYYCLIAFVFLPLDTLANYENQPKIQKSSGGGLVFQAAYDRNMTFRLSRDSSLLFNGVDVMEKIRQRYTPFVLDPNENRPPNVPSTQEIANEVHTLQSDLEALLHRVSSLENRTRSRVLSGTVRRSLDRLRRVGERVAVIEDNVAKDECTQTAELCKNGGTCHDSYNGFHCDCAEGWTGETCEDDEDECYLLAGTDLGCQNNAVCINTPGGYRCECAKGYAGTHCRLRSTTCQQLQSQELCGHGICVPANNPQGYTCICDQGWARNTTANANSTAALMCTLDVNECDEATNPCHSECINLPGNFKCGPCPAGYSGNGITCLDIDECSSNNGGCNLLPKVRCVNTEGSYRCGNCPNGWVGNGRTCELAPSNSCDAEKICHPQAKCEYISDIATCTCTHGMFGHGFGPDGCHSNPINDSCENHICKNNGTCISQGRSTSCICPLGYSGALCESADGCHPNPCENGGTCKPLANQSFKCTCGRGTTGKKCEVLRSVCGSVHSWPSGELTYPSDGTPEYAPFERCAWIIQANASNILNLTFTKFDVQGDADCSHDWLQIHDGNSLASQLIGRFCGQELPQGGNIISSTSQLFFWFRSDNETNKAGFHMKWQSQPHICGDTLEVGVQASGVIRSLGYPGKTPPFKECQWLYSAPYGNRFVLRIYDVTLGSLPNCTGDSLKIYDANFLLKEYCTTGNPEPIRSSTNEIKIHFHTDAVRKDSSFQMHYEVEPAIPHCGGAYTDASGLIVGPTEGTICLFLIQQPQGTQIKLEFTELALFIVENCNFQSIEVFDGKTDESALLTSLCSEKLPSPVTSSSNSILIRFKNRFPSENHRPKFMAKYTRVCEFRFFGPDEGEFTTPNYPKPYAERLTCTFHIYGPTETVVHANFTDFSIAETKLIKNQETLSNFTEGLQTYVDVYLSESTKTRYTEGAPMEVISELNKMTVVFHADLNPTKARGIRVAYSFEQINCGGVYTEPKGQFGKPSMYLGGCKYVFEAPEGKHVHLSFGMVSNDGSQSVLIYGNATGGKDYLLKNMSTFNYFEETFHFNVVTLIISNGFLIATEYEFVDRNETCGGNSSTLYGVIKTPGWPKSYMAQLNCVWIINAPIGNKIELTVQNFTLEPHCAGDYMEIRNGMFFDSPLIGRYCGSEIPSRMASFSNSLYLKFTSDNSVAGSGFHIQWEQTETGCGGKLTSYEGSIHPPIITSDDEFNYSNSDFTCDWTIHVSQGSSIALKVISPMDILELCRSNRLKIYDGSTTLRPMLHFNCAETQNTGSISLTSSSNEVLVVFTPRSRMRREFTLDYTTNCKMVLDHVQGVIESPNFPEMYPESLNCNWDIPAGANNKLKLAFSHLSLEAENMECEQDYVEVLDMKNEFVLQKYRLCAEIPPIINSEGNRLVVRFVTDYSTSKSGFRAEYSRSGCGELLMNPFGSIESPNSPYSVAMNCDWYIEVPAGSQIVFNVLALKLDPSSTDCSSDVLQAKEYKNATHTLFKQCVTQQTLVTITTPANRMYLNFRSGPSRALKYFKAMYHTKDASCGGVFRASSGLITSPNYPLNVTQEYQCKWDIVVPEYYGTILKFKDFKVSDSHNCSDTYLKVSSKYENNETLLNKYCGSELPETAITYSGRLILEFMNKGTQGWGKFALEFVKQCGGPITDGTGYLKSHVGESCLWTFNVTQGSLISLNFLQMNCFCDKLKSGECSNFLAIVVNRDGNATKICEHHTSNLVFEKSFLRVYAHGIDLRAKYSTTQHSCGGLITSPRGSLVSPYYPATYPPNSDCTWTISLAKGNSLQIEIDEMDIVKSDHCNEDYLEIRTMVPNKILGVFCGNELPDDLIISNEAVWIRFRSSEGNTGNGFKLNWRYAHSNEIGNNTFGLITSPPRLLTLEDEEPFTWRIVVPRNNYVSLFFQQYIDGLKLYDGFDESALTVAIPPSPWRFVSSSNVIFLQTDNDNLQYFAIKWNISNIKAFDGNETVSKCHTELSIKSQTRPTITSPGYPRGYENNLRCDWIFKPLKAIDHVVCEIYEAKLETSGSCSADYLQISASKDLIQWHEMHKICNSSNASHKPILVVHGTPNIKLDFVTDASINGTGFSARMRTQCGSNLTDAVGFIHGDALMYETACLWQIQVKQTKRINLQMDFPPVVAGNNHECLEYALIYDGIDEHAPLMAPGKICNPQNVSRLLLNSTSHSVAIKYKLSLPRPLMPKRWNLTYREYSECNEEYYLIPEAATINISSPNYPNLPQPFTECEWRVIAPRGELIQIDFVDRFDMNSRLCSKEYLEVFDGSTALARSIGKFCLKPSQLRTTQNILYMRYQTDISEPRRGFRARISISKCGSSYFGTNGVISSPGYPGPGSYPSSTQCDYVINLPNDATVHIEATDVHLPYDILSPKTNDYLEIIPNGLEAQTIFLFGNTTKGATFDINANKVIVRFHTFAKNTQYRGFSLKYTRYGGQCVQDVNGDSGHLTLHYPKRSYSSSFCRWKITVAKGQRVKLEFLNLNDLKEHNSTKVPSIEVFNDHEMISKLTSFNVNSFDPNAVIQSTDNLMIVQIQSPLVDFQFKTIRARYSSNDESSCPPNIGDDIQSGLIDIQDTQPFFSGPYYCFIRIKLSGKETLVFNITSFETTRNETASRINAPLTFRDQMLTSSYRENLTQVLQSHTQPLGYLRILQNDNEHIHRLRMDYRRHKCGGFYIAMSNIDLALPATVPAGYGPIICIWSLQRPFWSGRIDAQFTASGNFTFSDSCDREFILVKKGQLRNSEPIIKICRDNAERLENLALANLMTFIIYQSQDFRPDTSKVSMQIRQSVVCGGEVKVAQITSAVEVTKESYKNNQQCDWKFTTASGFYLQLQFYNRFFIEDSPNCTKDYLEVQRLDNALWFPEARFCGRTFPDIFNVSSSQIRVIWHTNENVTADGFSFIVRSHCSLTLNVTSTVKQIVSPALFGYGGRNPKCEYIFQSNETDKLINVRVQLLSGTFRQTNQCSFGGFLVTKRDSHGIEQKPERFCDLEFEETSYKFLKLNYDSSFLAKFSIEYSFNTCGGNITSSPATIRPLKNEEKNFYAHNMNCVWRVTAPPDHSISINFKYFDTEHNFDHVSIYSGTKIQEDSRQEKLSGNLTSHLPKVLVDHNQAVINAVSDISSSARGFEAQIVFLHNCNERISLTDGNSPVILTRTFKPTGDDKYLCVYRVTAPKGHRVQIDIKKMFVNNSTASCVDAQSTCQDSCNAIEVLDSAAHEQAKIGRFCSLPPSNVSFYSSYEDVILKFDGKVVGVYNFEISLTMVKSVCGDIQDYKLGAREVYKFVFPQNGDQSYPPNVHCTWRFRSDYWQKIHFNYIDLQNVSLVTGKCLDYIQIKGKYTYNEFCGHAANFSTHADRHPENTVDITFHSDATVQGKGVELILQRASYNNAACNQTYNQLSGTIRYENIYSSRSLCTDQIIVPENYVLNLYVAGMYFRSSNCSELHFRITDLKTNKTLLDRCHTTYANSDIFTTTNAVRLETFEYASINLFYMASERNKSAGCGGITKTSEGHIASPPYDNDRNFSECRWDIIVPAPNTIRVTFNEFNMGASTNCPLDNVQVIDVLPNGTNKTLTTLCGAEASIIPPSTSNHIAIISKKSPNYDGTGWNLQYQMRTTDNTD